MKHYSMIERLEARIAPAAAVYLASSGGHSATFSDAEGEMATVTFSKPILSASNVDAVLHVDNSGILELIDLTGLSAEAVQGTSITISVAGSVTGDGIANVGLINASSIDLGTVTIPGDLGKILAGSGSGSAPGLAKLSVYSMGDQGLASQGGSGDLHSVVQGALGALVVTQDFNGAYLQVTGGVHGKIGSITIGGSVDGGSTDDSGVIQSSGAMGAVKIAEQVTGGIDGVESGAIDAGGSIASVTIGGSLSGSVNATGSDTSFMSGVIISRGGEIGSVVIGRDLNGGAGDSSGFISGSLGIGSVTIVGSVSGNAGTDSGEIYSSMGKIGVVKIGGDLTGGDFTGNLYTGAIRAQTGITSVTVGGSVTAYESSSSAIIYTQTGNIGSVSIAEDLNGAATSLSTTASGEISSVGGSIGKIFIGGSASSGLGAAYGGNIYAAVDLGAITVVETLSGQSATQPFIIDGDGMLKPHGNTNLAIASVTVGGDVFDTNIVAGLGNGNTPNVDGHVQIGAITVGGSWYASNVAAGISAGGGGYYGSGNNVVLTGGDAVIPSKIASVSIAGGINGTNISGQSFGFEADEIGSFKYANVTIPLDGSTDITLATNVEVKEYGSM